MAALGMLLEPREGVFPYPVRSLKFRPKAGELLLDAIWPCDNDKPFAPFLRRQRLEIWRYEIAIHEGNMACRAEAFQSGHVCHNQTGPLPKFGSR